MSIGKYLVTGLKLLLINIVHSLLIYGVMALTAVIGFAGVIAMFKTPPSDATGTLILIASIVLFLLSMFISILAGGYIAQKLYHWR